MLRDIGKCPVIGRFTARVGQEELYLIICTGNVGQLRLPKLVYESDINSLVKRVKYFSFSTSIAAIIIQPLMLNKVSRFGVKP